MSVPDIEKADCPVCDQTPSPGDGVYVRQLDGRSVPAARCRGCGVVFDVTAGVNAAE